MGVFFLLVRLGWARTHLFCQRQNKGRTRSLAMTVFSRQAFCLFRARVPEMHADRTAVFCRRAACTPVAQASTFCLRFVEARGHAKNLGGNAYGVAVYFAAGEMDADRAAVFCRRATCTPVAQASPSLLQRRRLVSRQAHASSASPIHGLIFVSGGLPFYK